MFRLWNSNASVLREIVYWMQRGNEKLHNPLPLFSEIVSLIVRFIKLKQFHYFS